MIEAEAEANTVILDSENFVEYRADMRAYIIAQRVKLRNGDGEVRVEVWPYGYFKTKEAFKKLTASVILLDWNKEGD